MSKLSDNERLWHEVCDLVANASTLGGELAQVTHCILDAIDRHLASTPPSPARRDALLDILLDVQHGRATVYEAADRIEVAGASTPSAEVSTWNRAIEAAARAAEKSYRQDARNTEAADGAKYNAVSWEAIIARKRCAEDIRCLVKPAGGETAPSRFDHEADCPAKYGHRCRCDDPPGTRMGGETAGEAGKP